MLPPLADFLRWMSEMPEPFREPPLGFPNGRVAVHAVVGDLVETWSGQPAESSLREAFKPTGAGQLEQNRLRWVLAACHLLWHPALRTCDAETDRLKKLLVQDIASLAAVVPVDQLPVDEERREELIRRALGTLGLLLPGETEKEAADRLTQVDSVEHRRLLRAAADRERRTREVREMMARRAAEEAAAKVSRE